MTNQTAMPMSGDFCTVAYAAEHIGVSIRTVARLISPRDGEPAKLQRVQPLVGSRESGRGHTLLYTAEVKAYADARKLVR